MVGEESSQADREPAGGSSWPARSALVLVVFSPVLAPIIGSTFNIWYNSLHIMPLLTEGQKQLFTRGIVTYNGIVYPVALVLWLWLVMSMRTAYHGLREGKSPPPEVLARARIRVLNLPWYAAFILIAGWLGCIAYFVITLGSSGEAMHEAVMFHLPVSILISMMASLTYGVFGVEILTQRLLFPVLFRDALPSQVSGAFKLTLRRRGLLWAVTACVCPVGSLLLLLMVRAQESAEGDAAFAIAVATLGTVFALGSAVMLAKLVLNPIEELREAARAVEGGDLNTLVENLRADELGPLIDQFNRMVAEMRVKERINESFGLHVGREVADQILARDPGLGGLELEISVMFCDIRNFTSHSAANDAPAVVALLNEFLTAMVEVVQVHRGMVNKFLGDGFMALFGAGATPEGHAAAAVAAGQDMLDVLEMLREEGRIHQDMGIGIGIHTGTAVVGSIGSPRRLEHTAIGDTVNVASRVEGLTKAVGRPLAFTRATRDQLDEQFSPEALGAHPVKGVPVPVEIFTLPPRSTT